MLFVRAGSRSKSGKFCKHQLPLWWSLSEDGWVFFPLVNISFKKSHQLPVQCSASSSGVESWVRTARCPAGDARVGKGGKNGRGGGKKCLEAGCLMWGVPGGRIPARLGLFLLGCPLPASPNGAKPGSGSAPALLAPGKRPRASVRQGQQPRRMPGQKTAGRYCVRGLL